VETLEEAQMLSNVNCDYLQGYLLSKPVKSKEAGDMLELSYADVLEIA
jgi:EAL domain-containing protein (putative c-di-GMP-specific phosphodiesterase class I)